MEKKINKELAMAKLEIANLKKQLNRYNKVYDELIEAFDRFDNLKLGAKGCVQIIKHFRQKYEKGEE